MTERPQQPATDSGAGLPEDGQPGTGVDPKQHPENEQADDGGRAPTTSSPEDGDPAQATGNPRAAGGDS